jgi:hypothetical protein
MRMTCVDGGPPDCSQSWRVPAAMRVAFWDGLLRQLDGHDGTGWLVSEHAYNWTDRMVEVGGRDTVRIPSIGSCMRCRRLLELLRPQAAGVGVHIQAGRSPMPTPWLAAPTWSSPVTVSTAACLLPPEAFSTG